MGPKSSCSGLTPLPHHAAVLAATTVATVEGKVAPYHPDEPFHSPRPCVQSVPPEASHRSPRAPQIHRTRACLSCHASPGSEELSHLTQLKFRLL